MASARWFLLILAAGPMISSSGCLFHYDRERVIREEEPLKTARFESAEARHAFDSRALDDSQRKATESTDSLTIPFLLGLKSKRTLSQNAFYNDQLNLCDSNDDGVISAAEAAAYNPGAVAQSRQLAFQPASVATPTTQQRAPIPSSAGVEPRWPPIVQPASMQSTPPDARSVR